MKRTFFLVSLIVLAAMAFANGGSDASDSEVKVIRVFPERFTPGIDRAIETLPPLVAFEEIAEEYEATHPGIDIQFYEYAGDPQNTSEYSSWLTTQAIAGTLPELVFAHATVLENFSDNEWFVDVMPFLQEPNPYVPGNSQWIDLFGERIISTRQSGTGELWSLPISLVATAIYYNRDLFDDLNLEEPQDWEEFMDVLETIDSETDIIPFLYNMSTTSNTSWAYRVMLSFMFEPMLSEIDLDGNDIVSTEEFARAVKNGKLGANNEQHRALLELFDEWKEYFQEGFLSAPAQGLFTRGDAAMWWGGIWELLPLEADPLRDFNFSTFYIPRITSETTPYADDNTPVRMIGGAAGVQLAISNSAVKNDSVAECVDFLKFITTPENNGRITSESKELAPIVIGAKADDSLQSFLTQANNGITALIIERFFTPELMDEWFRTMQLYLAGNMDIDEATEILQGAYDEAADVLIEKNGFDF